MDFVRTPNERFSNLPGYPFRPNYVQLGGLRMHYVDEGPRNGPTMLLMHGNPTWSYLYRKMIPPLTGAGFRTLAPDLIGLGKSDKPTCISDYSYQAHVDWMRAFITQLDLRDVVLVCQDWGSLIGLRLAAEERDRFARIVVANGTLPTGDRPPPRLFRIWRAFARWSPVSPIGWMVRQGCAARFGDDILAAYDAPFPSRRFKSGVLAFPRLVPTSPNDPAAPANRAAWARLGEWHKPFLTVFGSRDPIMRGADKLLQEQVPGAKGQPHTVIRQAGHFIQEDKGEELAKLILDWMKGT